MNEQIKNHAKAKGVKLWEVAYRYGVSDGNFSRKLRRELSNVEKQQLIDIIDQLARERGGENENI